MKPKTIFYHFFFIQVLFTLVSWARYFLSNQQFSLVYKSPTKESLVLWVLFALTILWSLILVLKQPQISFSFIQEIVLLCVVFFQLPFISNDLYSYFYYGQLTLDGLSPYYRGNLQPNYFLQFCDPIYKETICMYGPIGLFFLKSIAYVSCQNIWLALFSYKLISLISLILTFIYFKKESINSILLLYPIVLLQAFGQGHLELFGILIVSIALIQWKKKKYFYFTLLLVIATLIKFHFVLFFSIIFLIPDIFKSFKVIPSIISAALLGILIAAFFYTPLILSPLDVLIPLKNMSQLRPSGGWQDIGTFIYCIANHIDGSISSHSIASYNFLKPFFTSIAVLLTALSFYTNRKTPKNWLFLLLFMVIFVISNRVFSWYFLLFIPLFISNFASAESQKWIFIIMFMYTLSESSLMVSHKVIESTIVVVFMLFAILYGFFTYKKLLACSKN